MSRYLFALLLVSLLVLPSSGQTAEDLYQQAVRIERLTGNTQAAIALYEQIVEEHPENREVTAKALLGLGNAYESLGREGAQAVYRQIIADFADFDAIVAEAKIGINRTSSGIASSALEKTFEVRNPEGFEEWGASLSPDGANLIAPFWGEDGNGVLVQNVRTGVSSVYSLRLENEACEGDGSAEFTSMSPDGSMIAAGWYPCDRGRFGSLRIRNLETGQVSQLVDTIKYWKHRHGKPLTNANAQALEWSANGKSILAFFSSTTDPEEGSADFGWYEELVLVHLDGSPPTFIAETNKPGVYSWANSCMTSDQKFVFTQYQKKNGPSPDIIVRFNLESGTHDVWKEDPVNKMVLVGCAANPERVLFTEERLGNKRLLFDSPSSLPGSYGHFLRNIQQDTFFATGSKRGDLIYWPKGEVGLWSAPLDPESVDITSQPGKQSQSSVWNGKWSPTGNQFAWFDNLERKVVIWNAEESTSKSLYQQEIGSERGLFPATFSEDGTKLRLGTIGDGDVIDLDTRTGAIVNRFDNEAYAELGVRFPSDYSETGTSYTLRESDNCVVELTLDSNRIKETSCTGADKTWGAVVMRISPNRKMAVVEWGDRQNEKATTQIEVINLISGDAHIVYQTNSSEYRYNRLSDWVGNEHVLLARQPHLHETGEFLLINVETGEKRSVLTGLISNLNVRTAFVSHDRRFLVAHGSPNLADADESRGTVLTDLLDQAN